MPLLVASLCQRNGGHSQQLRIRVSGGFLEQHWMLEERHRNLSRGAGKSADGEYGIVISKLH